MAMPRPEYEEDLDNEKRVKFKKYLKVWRFWLLLPFAILVFIYLIIFATIPNIIAFVCGKISNLFDCFGNFLSQRLIPITANPAYKFSKFMDDYIIEKIKEKKDKL